MNSVDFAKALQKGYYVALGLASTLLEMAQDPTKRDERIRDLDRFADELAEKGVTTEAEARSYVDTVVARQVRKDQDVQDAPTSSYPDYTQSSDSSTVNTVATTVTEESNSQDELQELTRQIASLRTELEQLRSK